MILEMKKKNGKGLKTDRVTDVNIQQTSGDQKILLKPAVQVS